jgi:hypothetical protein
MSDKLKLELERASITFNRAVEDPSVSILLQSDRHNYALYLERDGIRVSKAPGMGSVERGKISWNDFISLMEEKYAETRRQWEDK